MWLKDFKLKDFKIPKTRLSKPIVEIENKLEDVRVISKTKTFSEKAEKTKTTNLDISKKDLYEFFRRAPSLRMSKDIELYADYLSQNYQYFIKLKKEDSQLKVEKLTKICHIEKYFKGESIINYGEIGDKFYIVLEGIVEVYKPKYVEIELLPNDFINMLNLIKERDGNDLRYDRIKEKNKIFFDTYEAKDQQNNNNNINHTINSNNSESSKQSKRSGTKRSSVDNLKYKQVFLMEDEEKMGEYGEGFSFGDIALIKKTVRNATIKAKENCILLTIDKNDYNKAILEFQKKKLSREIDDFVKNYSFFKDFSHDRIIHLFNCFSKKFIFKGENLYEQNKKDEYLYIIKGGIFSITCKISFYWLNDYIEYINYDDKNILQYLIDNRNCKYVDLLKTIKNCYGKLENTLIPKNSDKNSLWDKIEEKQKKDDLFQLKKDEEKLNDPDNIYDIDIKKINYNEILGIEEIFEFKKRFCTCKCLSEKAEIKYISIYEFIKLIMNLGEDELKYLLKIVNERKKLIRNQIINAIKNKERKIKFNFDIRYENLLKEAELKKTSNENKSNQIFSTLKMKGIKYSLQDILDNNTPLLESDKKNRQSYTNKIKLNKTRKNKSSEILFKYYLSKNKSNNKVKLKVIKNIFNKRKIFSQKKEDNKANSAINLLNSVSMTSKYLYSKNVNRTRNESNYKNFASTVGSSSFKMNNRKVTNYSIDRNDKTFNKQQIERSTSKNFNENAKIIESNPNIKNIKIKEKVDKSEIDQNKNKLNKFSNIKIREAHAYESINLPNLFEKKIMRRTQSVFPHKLRKNIDYKDFFHVYDKDKNLYSGIGFKKILTNKYSSFEKKNYFELLNKITK